MSELAEWVQENMEQKENNKLNAKVAIWVSLTATFMAMCNIKDGNIVQAMAQAQAKSIDQWGYFQAKSTKQSMAQNTLELLTSGGKAIDSVLIGKYRKKLSDYEKEKEEIKRQAESYTAEYDALNVFDDQFDMTEAFLSISIALFGTAALTQQKRLFYFAAVVSTIGLLLGVAAFLHIRLHSEFFSKLLG